MKKILLSITLLFSVFSGTFAVNNKFVTNEVSISTGFPIYTDNSSSSRNTLINASDSNRIILGANATIDLNIAEPIKLVFAAETFCDFLWQKEYYFNTFDYGFYSGIKIFPGLGGLNFSIAYVLGNRGNAVYTEEQDKTFYFTDWGNGFRIAAQYDFLEDSGMNATPFAGAFFKYVPRGNFNQDYIISVYLGMKF